MALNDGKGRKSFEGVSFIPEDVLQEWTLRLGAGERGNEAQDWARAIIADFSVRAWLNEPQSQFVLSWLADAFDKILDFEDAREALALPKRPKHRPSGARAEYAMDVAFWVHLAMARGYSESIANKLAAKQFSCTVRSVRRMRDGCVEWVRGMNQGFDWDEHFRLKRCPLPTTIRSTRTLSKQFLSAQVTVLSVFSVVSR